MKKIFMLLFMFSLFGLSKADVFMKEDFVNLSIGIETTKGFSFPVTVEYGKKIEINRSVSEINLVVGNQIKFMDEQNDYSNFYTGVGIPFYLKHKIEELPNHVMPVFRIGLSSDLDSKSNGLYIASGLRFGDEKYLEILFEGEDSKYRNSLGIGYKFNEIKF
ncbi:MULTISPECIES: hypothetical protein [Bacteria]|uniref:hypothetical protein n=1 Tax=Bacteria TaxID=2 RepID=UPI002E7BB9CD|nr:hypothetical protein [Cetobacterium somerae]WVJ03151.1 hypothetical protein VSU16_14600 [Cetobacterium somerae]